MKKPVKIITLALLIVYVVSSCKTSISDPSLVTLEYLTALVGKETEKIISLSCKEWESNAVMDVDSLMNIKAELNEVKCKETGRTGSEAYVVYNGKIKLSYESEIQEIDLSTRTYTLKLENNDWRVCSYK